MKSPRKPRKPAVPVNADLQLLLAREIEFGGELYLLRPLGSADEDRIRAFFYSHTQETIQQRYGYHLTEMSRERAYQLVNVVQTRDLALGIFERALGDEILHAIGRYICDPDGAGAEVAFVVGETKRRLGMATTLLHTMIRIARLRGLRKFHAQVNRDNYEMLGIFRKNGASTQEIPGAEAVQVVIAL